MSASAFPIRIAALSARDFRGLAGEFQLELGTGLTLIVGENGAGKSSILNAIEWCLFGAEVTKKSSGIEERGEFELRHRGAEGEVSVTLELEVEAGRALLSRSRAADAKKSAPDELLLELPGGERLENAEVEDWMEWNQLPDWSLWKHAFCQHQELLRARVSVSGDRSTQLARLLGLDEYQELNSSLRELKPQRLKKAAAEELARVEEQLEHAIAAPGLELRDVEGQLEARGVGRSELNDAWLASRFEELLAEAADVAKGLELAVALPEARELKVEDWSVWSREFERVVGAASGEFERELGALRARTGELESTLAGIEPARRAHEDAKRAWDGEQREHGGAEQLAAQMAELAQERERLNGEEKGRNATVALLRHAVEELERRAKTSDCPVCESSVPDLKGSLVARVEREGGQVDRTAREALDARQSSLKRQQITLNERQSALQLAMSTFEGLSARLERFIGSNVADPARAAEEKRREWLKRVELLEAALDRCRVFVGRLRGERELVELFGKWRAAGRRAEASAGDLGSIRAWVELQATIDEAASLTVDLETLAAMARVAQEERSREQVESVNATLAKHANTIALDAGLHVTVKATATQLKYQLVDADGKERIPIMNQAALHALSFAVLFAQAEARAAQGLPAWIQLDDPGQSLDDERLDGLARAIEALVEQVPVLVASFPGVLESRLRRARDCRVLELGAARVQGGVVVRSVTDGGQL